MFAAWLIAALAAFFGPAPTLVCHDTDPGAGITYEAVTVSGFELYSHMIEYNSLAPAQHSDIWAPNRMSSGSPSYRTVEGRAIYDNNCVVPE